MLFSLRTYVPTALLGALCCYFGVQAMTGDRGILGWDQREALLEQRKLELKAINAERTDLEARAMLLQDENLSADLLEERARVMLGFADPRDYVIRVRQG